MVDNEIKTDNIKEWDKPYRSDGAKESAVAFETFILYRDMGVNRSLHKVAKQVNKKYEAVRHWSFKYKWTDRINAMNQYKIQENKRINQQIQEKEIDRINKRLDKKSQLINVLVDVLINNAKNYDNTELDFKEFSNLLNLVSRIENMNIADLNNN